MSTKLVRKMLAMVVASLYVQPPPLVAQEPHHQTDANVITLAAEATRSPASSGNARSALLREAIAQEARRLSQNAASSPVKPGNWVTRRPVQAGFWIGGA